MNNNNNRGNNRRRGRNNNRQQGGGQNMNRIDSRARGNAPQLLDKYKKLAEDAHRNGDRVQAEYYLQFADHYFRVIADGKPRQEDQPMRARNDDRFDRYEGDDDGEAEQGSYQSDSPARGDDNDGERQLERQGERQPREQREQRDQRDQREGNPFTRDNRQRRQRRDFGDAPAPVDAEAAEPRRSEPERAAPRMPAPQAETAPVAESGEERPAPRQRRTRRPREEAPAEAATEQAVANDGALDPSALPPAIGEAEDKPKRRGRPRKIKPEDAGASDEMKQAVNG